MRPRTVTTEHSAAPITEDEARIDYAGRSYVIVAIDEPIHTGRYAAQRSIWVIKLKGRKVIMGTLFGFTDEGRPTVWIGRTTGVPVRAADRRADDPYWTECKRAAAGRMIELRTAALASAGRPVCAGCTCDAYCREIFGDRYADMAAKAEDGCSQFTPKEVG